MFYFIFLASGATQVLGDRRRLRVLALLGYQVLVMLQDVKERL